MSSATTNGTFNLQNLLTRFGIKRLGEGDPAAGANLLATMACSLANIQRPGSGLVTSDGETIAVGTSLIVSRARSVSLISEKVLAGLASRQNNLLSQLSKKIQSIEEEPKKTKWPVSDSPVDFMASVQESIPDRLFQPWTWHDKQGAAEPWSQLVETPPEPSFKDLAAQPVVFVTGITSKELGTQLERSHLGRPMMHVGVTSAADFARFEQICPTVMDGRIIKGSTMASICGTVMMTDPSSALGKAVKTDPPSTKWLSRLLWLVDGDAGLEPGKPVEDKALIPLDRLAVRYDAAMKAAWGERLNSLTTAPAMIQFEFPQSQARWMGFLKTQESECPGISGTARSLFATLIFGLSRLINSTETAADFVWFTDEVEALARFLVQRMVNARAAMLHSADDDLKQHLMEKILCKLMDGPLEHRAIIRKCHKLPTTQCLELLNTLEGMGRVTRVDNRWQRVEPADTTAALSN
ncbi:MAG: hypothetical protein RLZZ214_1431 [Verrucomicrobiota bacterium]|jgi:hypothetical protein